MLRLSVFTAVLFTVLQAVAADTAVVPPKPVPFSYPDPRTVGIVPTMIDGHPGVPVTADRYAGISEQERQARIVQDQFAEIEGFEVPVKPDCPLCKDDPKTPCGQCKKCLDGFPCEKLLCRHCIQPLSKNMGNSCDLTAGDEPCGTCDACREHRSDPCEHADDGWGPLGEFNPYHEPRILSVIPRPILDEYNNGARKFPVYYNPAPYYRPTWNPSIYAGYARPYTFRWVCEKCGSEACECTRPSSGGKLGNAGQVAYGYVCKFCGRNPCACAVDICNSNKPMDPKGIAKSLAEMHKNTGVVANPEEIKEASSDSAPANNKGRDAADTLYEDDSPVTPEKGIPNQPVPKPQLDAPVPSAPPASTVGGTVS